jgi:flagellar biosynthetic protein FliO
MFDDSIFSAFISLILIVAALGGFLYIFKRFVKKHRRNNNQVNLEVISRVSLTPKNQLFVVKVEGKTLLIGATDQNLNTLAELGDEQNKDILELSTKANNSPLAKYKTPVKAQAPKKLPEFHGDDSLSFSSFLKQTFRKQTN